MKAPDGKPSDEVVGFGLLAGCFFGLALLITLLGLAVQWLWNSGYLFDSLFAAAVVFCLWLLYEEEIREKHLR